MKITLEQLKQNYLSIMADRFKTTIGDEEDWDEFNQQELDEQINELKSKLDKVQTIEQMVPFFDDSAIPAWDAYSIVKFTLKCCVI